MDLTDELMDKLDEQAKLDDAKAAEQRKKMKDFHESTEGQRIAVEAEIDVANEDAKAS